MKLTRGIGLALVAVVLIVVIFGSGLVGVSITPTDHRQIVDNIKIAFTIPAWGVPTSTTPRCVYSKIVTWGVEKPLSTFIPNKPYSYSIWLWEFQNEVQYVMQIWGPDEKGKGYDIQLMRNWNPPFTLTYKGETLINVGQISSAELVGNVWVYSEALYAFSVTVD